MADYRLLITGSRNWADKKRIFGALDALLAQMKLEPRKTLVVVHGDCPDGADAMARRWVYIKLNATVADVREERHPARWGVHGKRAGFLRNEEMVAAGADMCFAWIMPCSDERCRIAVEHGSHGATHCADLAEKAGIQTRRFTKS